MSVQYLSGIFTPCTYCTDLFNLIYLHFLIHIIIIVILCLIENLFKKYDLLIYLFIILMYCTYLYT